MVLVKKSKIMSIFYILLSILYGYIFILIPHSYFKDRVNYLSYAENYDFFIDLKGSVFSLDGEIFFLYINKFLSLFFSPEGVVYFFVFFINFTLCFVFFSYSRNFLLGLLGLLAFFLLPFGFSYQLGSLRQSLAVSIFLLAVFYIKKVNIKLILISIVLGFIHTSFFILTPFLVADYFFLKFFLADRWFYRTGLQALIALTFGLLLSIISKLFSVGKLEGYLQLDTGFGLFFIFFIPFLIVNLYRYYKLKQVDYFVFLSIVGVLAYTIFYFLSPIAGRLITIFIPFIFISIIKKMDFLNIFLLLYSIFVGGWLFLNGGYALIMNI